MNNEYLKLFEKLARYGVVHREEVKNYLGGLEKLLRKGFLQKAYKNGKVYYEATQKALPVLDSQRAVLLERAQAMNLLAPNSKFFKALLEDVRFLDKSHSTAKDYKFLGDWQLRRKAVPSQLELSKLRFYEEKTS